MAEGSWATMPRYNRFHYEVNRDFRGSPHCWTGTERYRIRLRDTFWLGLVHLLPVMNTWDEAIAEEEHLLLRHIRGQVDWNQVFAPPLLRSGLITNVPRRTVLLGTTSRAMNRL
jgi:hypothetical protein